MKKQTFKLFAFLLVSLFVEFPQGISQIVYTEGVEIGNDKNNRMTRMLNGDDGNFYCYRANVVDGRDFYSIEKRNKSDLSIVFLKDLDIPTSTVGSRVEDVQFAAGKVFVFWRLYDKEKQKMTFYCQTVSSSGKILKDNEELVSLTCDHYEFVNFDLLLNPEKTKFLVKIVHKEFSLDHYKTDFIIVDALENMKVSTRRVKQDLRSPRKQLIAYFASFTDINFGFCGMYFGDDDKIYYCVTTPANEVAESMKCKMLLYCLNVGEDIPYKIDMPINDDSYVRNVKILKSVENTIEIAGFFHENSAPSKSKFVKCGLFSFKLNKEEKAIDTKTFSVFDDAILEGLQSTKKKANELNYTLDDIIAIDNSLYYIGQQYIEKKSGPLFWAYDYRDILIVKLNSNSETQWVSRIPLLNQLSLNYRHTYNQYILYVNTKSFSVLLNDNFDNNKLYEGQDLKTKHAAPVGAIHGSNFVNNTINLQNGAIKHDKIFKNKSYCFAPIRERKTKFVLCSEEELYIPLGGNTIYVYTEDRGGDRFDKLKFE